MKRFLIFTLLLACSLQARVLVVVDNSYYQNSRAKVDRYVSEVTSIEGQNAELLVWNWNKSLDVRSACFPLWKSLQQKYVTQRTTADPLKGAVFIGQLPVPMFEHGEHVWDTVRLELDTVFAGNFPHDYYFMDLWNQNTSTAYAIDTLIWPYSVEKQKFFSMLPNNPGYKYWEDGDGKLDIWVTRVMAEYLSYIREGTTVLTEFQIIDKYLDRVHARMTAPALVPQRSFSMSGITEWGSRPNNRPDGILCLDILNLPFHTRFEHPNNNPANFIGQLQSGPRGNVNYGGYFGTRYRAERNRRDCTWGSLFNVTTGSWVSNLDTLGYEWAGVYEHGSPTNFACNGVHHVGDNTFTGLNGNFASYNYAPMVDSTRLIIDANGYNGSYYRFSNFDFPASPWGWGPEWRGRDAYWKASLATKGDYNIYIYYVASSLNADNLVMRIEQAPINNSGSIMNIGSTTISQKTHASPESPGSNWELLGQYSFSTFYDTAVVKMMTNGMGNGRFIIDAVKFVGIPGTATQGIEVIVDEQSPSFTFPDWFSRSMMDMQDEDVVNHNKYSKVPFFLANSCHLSDYSSVTGTAGNNVGLLMAMTHSGLISMGSVNSNRSGNDYLDYITALKNGKCFGDAFLEYANSNGITDISFIMLGAGTLKSQPYISYGSRILRNATLANADYNYSEPLHLINITAVAGNTSTIVASKEIRIAPETRFNRGSTVNLIVR